VMLDEEAEASSSLLKPRRAAGTDLLRIDLGGACRFGERRRKL
jgi:hypothetical protein